MIVLLTGQVGLDKSVYLNEAKTLATEMGKRLDYATVGQRMIETYGGKIDDRTILNLPKSQLDLLRRYAWECIINDIQDLETDTIFIVNSHAVFRWHHGLFPAVDLDLSLDLKPDVLITLIDDIDNIQQGLNNRETPFFELWELLAWREEEVWFTKFLSESLNKQTEDKEIKFFVLPRKQGPKLLLKLLTEPTTPKVYISFPITGLGDEEKESVNTFKEKVKEKFIAFDPLAIEERAIITTLYSLEREVTEELIPVKVKFDKISDQIKARNLLWVPKWDSKSPIGLIDFKKEDMWLKGKDVASVSEAIDSQIISRDFLLIDQSDFVIMYIRTSDEGVPQISAGCQAEMVYAYSQGKLVYVVCSGGRRKLSPWVTQFSEVFENLDQALEFLQSKYS